MKVSCSINELCITIIHVENPEQQVFLIPTVLLILMKYVTLIVFGDESGISVTFHFWKEQNMTSKCNLLHEDNVLS